MGPRHLRRIRTGRYYHLHPHGELLACESLTSASRTRITLCTCSGCGPLLERRLATGHAASPPGLSFGLSSILTFLSLFLHVTAINHHQSSLPASSSCHPVILSSHRPLPPALPPPPTPTPTPTKKDGELLRTWSSSLLPAIYRGGGGPMFFVC